MKSIVLVLLSLIPAVAFAQQDYVGASATLIANRGNAGYNEIGQTGWTFGVNAEVAKNVLGDRLVVLGSVGYDRMQKVYIGDGHDTRFGGYARLYLNGEQGDDARFFVSGGVGYNRHSNSQYSKAAINPSIGGGVNIRNTLIFTGSYLLPDLISENNVKGVSIGAELFHPISKSGKLQLHLESSLTFFGFKQAGFADRLWAAQLRNSVGIAYFPNYEKE